MKTLSTVILIALIAVILFDGIEKHQQTSAKIQALEYQHTRDSLVIESLTTPKETDNITFSVDSGGTIRRVPNPELVIDLKKQNKELQAQLGWYESQWSNLTDNGD